jgi:hypothetical protein
LEERWSYRKQIFVFDDVFSIGVERIKNEPLLLLSTAITMIFEMMYEKQKDVFSRTPVIYPYLFWKTHVQEKPHDERYWHEWESSSARY